MDWMWHDLKRGHIRDALDRRELLSATRSPWRTQLLRKIAFSEVRTFSEAHIPAPVYDAARDVYRMLRRRPR
jgi:hypothetical protein